MLELFDRPIVLAAWTVAVVLIFFGVGKFALRHERSKGVFGAALTFFLIMNGVALETGCTSQAVNRRDGPEAPTDAQIDSVRIEDAAPVPQTKTAPVAATDVPIPTEFLAEGRWTKFKSFWNKLDRVEPKRRPAASKVGPVPYGGAYTNTLTADEQKAYRAELASILGRPETELYRLVHSPAHRVADVSSDTLSPLAEILVRLSLRRIEHMGFDRHMVTRMMPPPSATFRGSLVDEIEQRIDSLLALRVAGTVDEEVFEAGLQKLQDDVYLFSTLALLDHRYWRFGPVPEKNAGEARPPGWIDQQGHRNALWYDPDAWIRGFEKAHQRSVETQRQAGPAKLPDELDRTYRAVEAQLSELKVLEPQLDALIEELER